MIALAPKPVVTLLVAVQAQEETRRRLTKILADLGHHVVSSPVDADVLVVDDDTQQHNTIPVLSVGGHARDAAGLIPADADPTTIDAALRAVAAGLQVRMPEAGFEPLAEPPVQGLLTLREIEVLAAMAKGLGNKEIARVLEISLHTVKFHIEAIFRKLGVRSRAEAVARGLQQREF